MDQIHFLLPFFFIQKDPRKAENFDKCFTNNPYKKTVCDPLVLASINEDTFKNFSCYNPLFRQ